MCRKTELRIECEKCGYPYCDARYPDNWDYPLDCYENYDVLIEHIERVGDMLNANISRC